MNIRVALILLVVAICINGGESWGFSNIVRAVKSAAKKVAPVVKTGASFIQAHPEIAKSAMRMAAATGDEEFLNSMKNLKAYDQDSYDETIESLRSEFSEMMSDEGADDMINDLESLIAMDDGAAKEVMNSDFEQKFISALMQ